MDTIDLLKKISIDSLQGTPVYDELKKDFDSVLKYQEAVCILVNNPDESQINVLRIGTVLSFSVIGKILQGKNPKDFSKEDWKDVADNIADYGIKMDGQRYTEFVFNLFALYIDYSVDIPKETISEKSAAEIKRLAADLRANTDKLETGKVTEPNYVDDCLWISFEAMIKLLSAYKTRGLCEEYAGFIQAVADISVQYGRYKLYQRELSLINSYLEGQERLDEQLKTEYNQYIDALQTERDEFNMLIEHAFSDDFEGLLKNSVELAQKTGVDKDKILDSSESIDSFFLN